VTIAYASVREMTRSMSNSRYLSTATPTHSENTNNPARKKALPRAPGTVPIPKPARAAANPAISHFSCWRRSPDERSQLADA
jgi:hypothetical protein